MDDTTQRKAASTQLKENEGEAMGGAEVCEPAEKRPMTECDFCEFRCTEMNRLLKENRALKCELDKRKVSEPFLKDDNVKVMYYTGLPHFEVLMSLLACVVPYQPQSDKVLLPFQMRFLTLMRLRLNLPIQ